VQYLRRQSADAAMGAMLLSRGTRLLSFAARVLANVEPHENVRRLSRQTHFIANRYGLSDSVNDDRALGPLFRPEHQAALDACTFGKPTAMLVTETQGTITFETGSLILTPAQFFALRRTLALPT